MLIPLYKQMAETFFIEKFDKNKIDQIFYRLIPLVQYTLIVMR